MVDEEPLRQRREIDVTVLVWESLILCNYEDWALKIVEIHVAQKFYASIVLWPPPLLPWCYVKSR